MDSREVGWRRGFGWQEDPRTLGEPVEKVANSEKAKGREVEEQEEKEKEEKVKYRRRTWWKVQRKDRKLSYSEDERRRERKERQQ